MKFPWDKYKELPLSKRNTLQVFITKACNLRCPGCFVRNVSEGEEGFMSFEEYVSALSQAIYKGVKQINILGGEPFLHPKLQRMLALNSFLALKTTIYTNGLGLKTKMDLHGAKLRVSIYGFKGLKGVLSLPDHSKVKHSFDANFMVGKETKLETLLSVANICEAVYRCKVFFISSIRELDNPNQEFFDDTNLTMPVLEYKKLVHQFLNEYEGDMEIHISKRGVFESTQSLPHNKCKFANYFIGGKIIQCPYDVINLKYQKDYKFDSRYCQQNNTCLMSKIILKPKKK